MNTIPDLTLPGESSVVVAGDWHGNINWVQQVFPFIRRAVSGTRTLISLGDFGYWGEPKGRGFADTVSYWARAAGIERILIVGGNHENWAELDRLFAAAPGEPVEVADRVFMMPRGYRFTLAGKHYAAFGGAASLDYADRTPFKDWWPTEIPTEEDVARVIAGGPADVLLLHEAIANGTELAERVLRSNPLGWDADALAYSALSRDRVTRVFKGLRPAITAHGHLHVKSERTYEDGSRVYSVAADGDAGNLAVLNLETLRWTWLGDPRAWKR